MRKWVVAILALGVLGLAAFWLLTMPSRVVAAGDTSLESGGDATRGRTVFFAGGCASCHATPGQEDRLKLGGGYALPSPFGTFYAPNISPHPQDGIGKWTTADLANALIAGVAPDGSHYYPAFPYTTYARMTLGDVKDLMAYLRTLEPVAGKARGHDMPFPFNIRRGLGLWKLLHLDRSPLPAAPDRDEEWRRGRYLVEALGHCAECHSPRDLSGGIVAAQRDAGGPEPHGKGWVPNITQSPNGLAKWSAIDIFGFLKSGIDPEGDSAGGSMASVVKNMAELSDADLKAMAAYIKSLPPREGPPKPAKK